MAKLAKYGYGEQPPLPKCRIPQLSLSKSSDTRHTFNTQAASNYSLNQPRSAKSCPDRSEYSNSEANFKSVNQAISRSNSRNYKSLLTVQKQNSQVLRSEESPPADCKKSLSRNYYRSAASFQNDVSKNRSLPSRTRSRSAVSFQYMSDESPPSDFKTSLKNPNCRQTSLTISDANQCNNSEDSEPADCQESSSRQNITSDSKQDVGYSKLKNEPHYKVETRHEYVPVSEDKKPHVPVCKDKKPHVPVCEDKKPPVVLTSKLKKEPQFKIETSTPENKKPCQKISNKTISSNRTSTLSNPNCWARCFGIIKNKRPQLRHYYWNYEVPCPQNVPNTREKLHKGNGRHLILSKDTLKKELPLNIKTATSTSICSDDVQDNPQSWSWQTEISTAHIEMPICNTTPPTIDKRQARFRFSRLEKRFKPPKQKPFRPCGVPGVISSRGKRRLAAMRWYNERKTRKRLEELKEDDDTCLGKVFRQRNPRMCGRPNASSVAKHFYRINKISAVNFIIPAQVSEKLPKRKRCIRLKVCHLTEFCTAVTHAKFVCYYYNRWKVLDVFEGMPVHEKEFKGDRKCIDEDIEFTDEEEEFSPASSVCFGGREEAQAALQCNKNVMELTKKYESEAGFSKVSRDDAKREDPCGEKKTDEDLTVESTNARRRSREFVNPSIGKVVSQFAQVPFRHQESHLSIRQKQTSGGFQDRKSVWRDFGTSSLILEERKIQSKNINSEIQGLISKQLMGRLRENYSHKSSVSSEVDHKKVDEGDGKCKTPGLKFEKSAAHHGPCEKNVISQKKISKPDLHPEPTSPTINTISQSMPFLIRPVQEAVSNSMPSLPPQPTSQLSYRAFNSLAAGYNKRIEERKPLGPGPYAVRNDIFPPLGIPTNHPMLGTLETERGQFLRMPTTNMKSTRSSVYQLGSPPVCPPPPSNEVLKKSVEWFKSPTKKVGNMVSFLPATVEETKSTGKSEESSREKECLLESSSFETSVERENHDEELVEKVKKENTCFNESEEKREIEKIRVEEPKEKTPKRFPFMRVTSGDTTPRPVKIKELPQLKRLQESLFAMRVTADEEPIKKKTAPTPRLPHMGKIGVKVDTVCFDEPIMYEYIPGSDKGVVGIVSKTADDIKVLNHFQKKNFNKPVFEEFDLFKKGPANTVGVSIDTLQEEVNEMTRPRYKYEPTFTSSEDVIKHAREEWLLKSKTSNESSGLTSGSDNRCCFKEPKCKHKTGISLLSLFKSRKIRRDEPSKFSADIQKVDEPLSVENGRKDVKSSQNDNVPLVCVKQITGSASLPKAVERILAIQSFRPDLNEQTRIEAGVSKDEKCTNVPDSTTFKDHSIAIQKSKIKGDQEKSCRSPKSPKSPKAVDNQTFQKHSIPIEDGYEPECKDQLDEGIQARISKSEVVNKMSPKEQMKEEILKEILDWLQTVKAELRAQENTNEMGKPEDEEEAFDLISCESQTDLLSCQKDPDNAIEDHTKKIPFGVYNEEEDDPNLAAGSVDDKLEFCLCSPDENIDQPFEICTSEEFLPTDYGAISNISSKNDKSCQASPRDVHKTRVIFPDEEIPEINFDTTPLTHEYSCEVDENFGNDIDEADETETCFIIEDFTDDTTEIPEEPKQTCTEKVKKLPREIKPIYKPKDPEDASETFKPQKTHKTVAFLEPMEPKEPFSKKSKEKSNFESPNGNIRILNPNCPIHGEDFMGDLIVVDPQCPIHGMDFRLVQNYEYKGNKHPILKNGKVTKTLEKDVQEEIPEYECPCKDVKCSCTEESEDSPVEDNKERYPIIIDKKFDIKPEFRTAVGHNVQGRCTRCLKKKSLQDKSEIIEPSKERYPIFIDKKINIKPEFSAAVGHSVCSTCPRCLKKKSLQDKSGMIETLPSRINRRNEKAQTSLKKLKEKIICETCFSRKAQKAGVTERLCSSCFDRKFQKITQACNSCNQKIHPNKKSERSLSSFMKNERESSPKHRSVSNIIATDKRQNTSPRPFRQNISGGYTTEKTYKNASDIPPKTCTWTEERKVTRPVADSVQNQKYQQRIASQRAQTMQSQEEKIVQQKTFPRSSISGSSIQIQKNQKTVVQQRPCATCPQSSIPGTSMQNQKTQKGIGQQRPCATRPQSSIPGTSMQNQKNQKTIVQQRPCATCPESGISDSTQSNDTECENTKKFFTETDDDFIVPLELISISEGVRQKMDQVTTSQASGSFEPADSSLEEYRITSLSSSDSMKPCISKKSRSSEESTQSDSIKLYIMEKESLENSDISTDSPTSVGFYHS